MFFQESEGSIKIRLTAPQFPSFCRKYFIQRVSKEFSASSNRFTWWLHHPYLVNRRLLNSFRSRWFCEFASFLSLYHFRLLRSTLAFVIHQKWSIKKFSGLRFIIFYCSPLKHRLTSQQLISYNKPPRFYSLKANESGKGRSDFVEDFVTFKCEFSCKSFRRKKSHGFLFELKNAPKIKFNNL